MISHIGLMEHILEINNLTRAKMDGKYFEKVAETVFKVCKLKNSLKISLVLVDEKISKELNGQYRRKNQPTDVLSFLYSKDEGEIVICYPIAQKQAKLYNINVKAELTRLLVHGILHLAEYDHIQKEERLDMQNLEAYILGHLKILI